MPESQDIILERNHELLKSPLEENTREETDELKERSLV